MGMHIDKAGGDDLARDIDLVRPGGSGDRADLGDTVTLDRDIGTEARPAAAVDHLAAAQDPIGHRNPPPRTAKSLS